MSRQFSIDLLTFEQLFVDNSRHLTISAELQQVNIFVTLTLKWHLAAGYLKTVPNIPFTQCFVPRQIDLS